VLAYMSQDDPDYSTDRKFTRLSAVGGHR